MRTRLFVTLIFVIIGVVAVAAFRTFDARPVATNIPPTASAAPTAVAGPPAEGSVAPAATSASISTDASAFPVPSPAANHVTGIPVAGSPAPAASGALAAAPVPTLSPTASPSANPNLLAMASGAFVRRWTLGGLQTNPQNLAQNGGVAVVPSYAGSVEVTFELPSVAHIDRVGVTLRGLETVHVEVAVATDSQSFHNTGTTEVALPSDNERERFVDAGANARFVRFTLRHGADPQLRIARVAAYGAGGPSQRGTLSGTWVVADDVSVLPDVVFAGVRGSVPDTLPPGARHELKIASERDGVLTVFGCQNRGAPWHGNVTENIAQNGAERIQLAGKGNLLVGYASGRYFLALRSRPTPACEPATAGTGATVLALVRNTSERPAELAPAFFSGYRFERRLAPLLDAAQLQRAQFAILDGDCTASADFLPSQQRTLLQWIASGHKLIIRDSDICSSSDYSFLPYQFSTKPPGANGARGSVLAIADPSTLGSGPNDPAHVLDTAAYLKNMFQQIGDADVVETDDPHWCGHLFSTNALGASGWVHAYARYGRGLIIYDGFDRDDLHKELTTALRVVALEYAQPAGAELPCNARVASLLAIYPSSEHALVAGKPTVLRVPMRLSFTTRQKSGRDVALSIAGDASYEARISPAHVRLAPGSGNPVVATLLLPAGWSGAHAFTVTATGAPGLAAQATIHIEGSVALATALESQRRVRIYGIHFDVDSAKIQPRSEPTIAQIAQVLGAHRDWRMRVEGHTDNDGGAAYNRDLSARRGAAVVADLVARYHVARARLTSAGWGSKRPVASNGTEAGKALNRRVELVRV